MSDINKKNLEAIGFIGTESDMVFVIPHGDDSELHIEKETLGENYNIMFTRGKTYGVPGKDFDFVYAGPAKSVDQINQLVNLLIL
ncbi:hypothetical protein [Tenacibaculum halocynthiae]|uniref:hypothetical protein n=1 Tax=Tenacibaculum halocynthiae TaxID=1254437 RepID=UPI003D64B814